MTRQQKSWQNYKNSAILNGAIARLVKAKKLEIAEDGLSMKATAYGRECADIAPDILPGMSYAAWLVAKEAKIDYSQLRQYDPD